MAVGGWVMWSRRIGPPERAPLRTGLRWMESGPNGSVKPGNKGRVSYLESQVSLGLEGQRDHRDLEFAVAGGQAAVEGATRGRDLVGHALRQGGNHHRQEKGEELELHLEAFLRVFFVRFSVGGRRVSASAERSRVNVERGHEHPQRRARRAKGSVTYGDLRDFLVALVPASLRMREEEAEGRRRREPQGRRGTWRHAGPDSASLAALCATSVDAVVVGMRDLRRLRCPARSRGGGEATAGAAPSWLSLWRWAPSTGVQTHACIRRRRTPDLPARPHG